MYVDVLRKVTTRVPNKQDQAASLLAQLDRLRRTYGCVFRVLHHFRKYQGFRSGRGSQEIGGSYVLGASAENSIFFEPTSRKSGAPAAIDIQLKDGAPLPRFQMRIVEEGSLVRLLMEDAGGERTDARERVLEALATLGPVDEPKDGHPGASIGSLVAAVKLSEVTVRRALKALQEDSQADVVGRAAKGKALWGVTTLVDQASITRQEGVESVQNDNPDAPFCLITPSVTKHDHAEAHPSADVAARIVHHLST